MTIRAVFLGTPEAAMPALEALNGLVDVVRVITRPDRPRGRSKAPQPSAVKLAAADLGLPVSQPHTKDELRSVIASIGQVDVGVVVAFGMIVPEDVLAQPHHGFVNVHFSLLPRWRGAAPVQRAIAEGDVRSGVTMMKMDEGLDTGGIISQVEVDIEPDDTAATLTHRLAAQGADLLIDELPSYLDGSLKVRPQSTTGITYAAKVLPEEARLDFSGDQSTLSAAIRAFNPKPGAYARHESGRIKIWEVEPRGSAGLSPGELGMAAGELLAGTAGDAVALIEIQPAGKRRMSGEEWARGRQGELGRLR